MENSISLLHKSPLFRSICEDEIKKMLPCLQARSESFAEGDNIVLTNSEVCIVTNGEIYVKDFEENTLHTYHSRDIIIQAPLSQLVKLVAGAECTVIFLNTYKALTVCVKNCAYHQTFIKNLFKVSNDKTAYLTEWLYHTSKPTTKEKLMSYFKSQSVKYGSNVFELHLTRKELAEYLKVDRAAMTTALFSLQDEGYVKINKNRFELLR